jgi:hypothetical protein
MMFGCSQSRSAQEVPFVLSKSRVVDNACSPSAAAQLAGVMANCCSIHRGFWRSRAPAATGAGLGAGVTACLTPGRIALPRHRIADRPIRRQHCLKAGHRARFASDEDWRAVRHSQREDAGGDDLKLPLSKSDHSFSSRSRSRFFLQDGLVKVTQWGSRRLGHSVVRRRGRRPTRGGLPAVSDTGAAGELSTAQSSSSLNFIN